MSQRDTQRVEMDLLLDAIRRGRGYDFRDYAQASLRRRVASVMARLQVDHISELISHVLHNDEAFSAFLREMSVTVTEMFRDPSFYTALREDVIPHLHSYPLVKVWHAGCATGEEVYSMAVLLKEEGLLEKTQIYGTDYNNESLDTARDGIYALDRMNKFTANYMRTAPKGSLSDHYHARYEAAKMSDVLRERITFANHNLVIDGVFGEMNVIVCRNVLIYFNKELQNRVLNLFEDSLCHRGFLCLGSKESLKFSTVAEGFVEVSRKERIFRRTRVPSSLGGDHG